MVSLKRIAGLTWYFIFEKKYNINRRDFINGFALSLAAGGGLAPIEIIANDKRRYPPALMGMRGSNPGSFEVAHALAWGGAKFDKPKIQTDHDYDLVVVGEGYQVFLQLIFLGSDTVMTQKF